MQFSMLCAAISIPLHACAYAQKSVCKWENKSSLPPQILTLLDLIYQSPEQKFYPLDINFIKKHFSNLSPSAVEYRNIHDGSGTTNRISLTYAYPEDTEQKSIINFSTFHQSQFRIFIRKELNENRNFFENRVFSDVTKKKNSSSIFSFYYLNLNQDVKSVFENFEKNNADILSGGKLVLKEVPGCLVSSVMVDDRVVSVSAFYGPRARLKSFEERASFLSCREAFFAAMSGFHAYAFQDPRTFNARPKWNNDFKPRDYIWKYKEFQGLIRSSDGENAQAMCDRLLPKIVVE